MFVIIPPTMSSSITPYGDFILSKKFIGGILVMSRNLKSKKPAIAISGLLGRANMESIIPKTSSITTSEGSSFPFQITFMYFVSNKDMIKVDKVVRISKF